MNTSDLYQTAIKSLAQSDTGHGKLDAPDGAALLDNPLCGDRVEMEVRLAGERVAEIAHRVKGCLLCRAAASVIGSRAVGANAAEIQGAADRLKAMLETEKLPPAGWEGGWDEFSVFAPVRDYRSRHGCVLLPFQALLSAIRAGQG
ncbi:MAG: iron-sulfur cluster assembly scaffold protein [Rhodocyclaceae bacterium]|nr:iron-sulfur cluster assembly scaffold protein [Rhodocyclaceae bacterium]